MELYVIYGLPGVGKLAVARELARRRPGYKLFHIHLLADMLEPVFGFDGRGFIRLRDRIWPWCSNWPSTTAYVCPDVRCSSNRNPLITSLYR